MTDKKGTVFVVDDDDAIRNGLSMLLDTHGYAVETFPSAATFLQRSESPMPERSMAILDLNMPDMDGLELQAELQRRRAPVPTVFLSGEGDIPAAVQAVQNGAVDFVEKPVDTNLLIDRIDTALKQWDSKHEGNTEAREALACLDSLTAREREVLDNLAGGKISKIIAQDLAISERTVELHRSRILKKMGARNTAELLNRVIPVLRGANGSQG